MNSVEAKDMNAYQRTQNYLTEEVKKIYRRYLIKSEMYEAGVKKVMNMPVDPTNIVKLQTFVKSVKDTPGACSEK